MTISKTPRTRHNSYLQALGLLATHLHHNTVGNDEYWGSEEDIELGNTSYGKIIEAVGFDPNEDENWGGYTNRATSVEIDQYNIIELLERFEGISRNDKTPLYVAFFEALYLPSEWRRIAPELDYSLSNDTLLPDPEDTTFYIENQVSPEDIRLWRKEQLGADAGWSLEEVEKLASLQVGEGVFSYSDQCHSLIRIR